MNQKWQSNRSRQKKIRFIAYLITLIGIFIVFEILGHVRLSFALKKELPVEVMRSMIDWVDYFHHHRGAVWLSNNDLPQSLVFEKVKLGNEFILLQGDSWIERIETNLSDGKPKQNRESVFFNELSPSLQSLGYINAGIGSFSPSLAEGQLKFLKKRFGIDPQYIVLFIDQTDYGDELYRYSHLIKRAEGAISNISEDNYFQFKSQYKEIVDYYDSNFKSLGLIKYEITKIIRKLKKDDKIIELEKILSPLSRELTNEENENIKVAILGYINEALRSDKLKKLLIVTHPHLKHLSGVKYTNQMHNSVVAAYQDLDQNQKSKVCISVIEPLNSYKFASLDDIFYVNDPTSHLKPEYQTIQFPRELARSLTSCAQ